MQKSICTAIPLLDAPYLGTHHARAPLPTTHHHHSHLSDAPRLGTHHARAPRGGITREELVRARSGDSVWDALLSSGEVYAGGVHQRVHDIMPRLVIWLGSPISAGRGGERISYSCPNFVAIA